MLEFKLARSSERAATRRAVLRGMGVGAVAIGSGAAIAQPAGPVAPPSTVTNPPRDFSPRGAPTTYFSDPDILTLDPSFSTQPNAAIQRLWTGALWAEGPAWNAKGRYLLWSDIPNNRQLRWLEDDGRVSVFRAPSNNSNGNTFDFQGRQLSCEHLTRRVVRYELDGSVTVLADSFEVELTLSGLTLTVPPDRSLLDVVEEAGVLVLSSCQEGTCGTCETPVLAGEVDHRDSLLTPAEQAANDTMFICVSRAACPRLVLEL